MNTSYPVYRPWATGHRIKAIVGHYGSGKTEFALNLALASRASGRDTALADLDIVNPFFRSAERAELLRDRGVEIIYPPYALTGVDVPVLPAEVQSIFARPALNAVLDIGGDDAGAAALGRYKPQLDAQGCDLLYVVNVFRPFSDSADRIVQLLERIVRTTRLQPAGLINNSNMGALSGPEHLLIGQEIVEQASRRLGIPVLAACAMPQILEALPPMDVPLFSMERFMTLDWMGT